MPQRPFPTGPEHLWWHKRPRSLADFKDRNPLELSCLYTDVWSFDIGQCHMDPSNPCKFHGTHSPTQGYRAPLSSWTPEERRAYDEKVEEARR